MSKTIIIFNLTSYTNIPGGAQESIEGLIKFFTTKSWRIVYVTTSISIYESTPINDSSSPMVNRLTLELSGFSCFLVSFLQILAHLSTLKPSLVWSHHPFPYILFKFFLFPYPTIVSFHGPGIKELKTNKSSLIKQILFRVLSILSSFRTLHHYNSSYIYSEVAADKVACRFCRISDFVAPLLVFPPYYLSLLQKDTPIPEKLEHILSKYPSYKHIVLVPRRIERRSGVLEFMSCLKHLSCLSPDFLFVFTGSGPEFPLVDNASKLINNAVLTGFVSQQELFSLFKLATLFVVPSLDIEGYCLPARIAYLLGKPLISTGQGGISTAYPHTSGHYLFSFSQSAPYLSNLFYDACHYNFTDSEVESRFLQARIDYESAISRMLALLEISL